MNKSKKMYKKKVKRKYVEFYPTDTLILEYIERRKAEGINFATLVKSLLTLEASKEVLERAESNVNTVLNRLLNTLYEVYEYGDK